MSNFINCDPIPPTPTMPMSQPQIPGRDLNLLFTKSQCAQWLSRLLVSIHALNHEALALLFWLADEEFGKKSEALEVLLSEGERIRLLPEIKKNLDDASDLAGVVLAVLGPAPRGRIRNLSREISKLLERWIESSHHGTKSPLEHHLTNTGQLFGLSDAEVRVAHFFSALQWWEPINAFFDRNLSCERPSNRFLLKIALGIEQSELASVFSGKLFKIGIMDGDRSFLSVDSDFLPYFVDPDHASTHDEFFRKTPKPELSMTDLGLPAAETEYLKAMFSSKQEAPLHVLVYGPAGTGKSSLWKALVAEMGFDGFEVMGKGVNRRGMRGAALAACLEVTSGRPESVVVVDEADGLLGTQSPWDHRGESLEKAWVNDLMERPGLRCLWVVNSHENIDPAILRRFTYSLEMKPLNWKKRGAMLDSVLRRNGIKRHFTQAHIEEFSKGFDLAPAVFDTAAKAVLRVQGNPANSRMAFRRALQAKARLLGMKPASRTKNRVPTFLSEAINADRGVGELTGILSNYQGKQGEDTSPLGFLFYGPPGTGKTFTARHLADQAGIPALSVKASDWLNPYVGVTEQRIAAAFNKAADDGAVLIIDEVDTFLKARRSGGPSWESSMVNELLVQIERHCGLIICTTNRLDSLDGAALRRFRVKVGFSYLRPAQVADLYGKILAPLVHSRLTVAEKSDLFELEGVTPADIFLVRDNALLLGSGTSTHTRLISEIRDEVFLKKEPLAGRAIGF